MIQLKCQLANHQEKKIITICLDKNCQQKRLCCWRCVSQFHGGHDDKLIEVEQFNNFMKKMSNQQSDAPEFYTYAQKQIIHGLENLCKLIAHFQKIVQERLQEIQGQNLQEYIKGFDNKQGYDSFNKSIEQILEYVEVDNGAIVQKKQHDSQLNQMESRSIQILKDSEQSLLKIIESFDVSASLKPLIFNEIPIELNLIQLYKPSFHKMDRLLCQDQKIKLQRCGKLKVNKQDKQYNSIHNVRIRWHCLQTINIWHILMIFFTYTIQKSIAFSQDTQYLLTGDLNRKLIVWKTLDMTQVHFFEIDTCITVLIISPDNKFISCLASSIQIWNFQKRMKIIQENDIHKYGHSLSQSADSQIYITSGSEGLIKIWKLNQLLQDDKYSLTLTRQIRTGSKYVKALLTMDLQYIISICNNDGKIMIYERESGKLIQELDSGERSGNISSISLSNDMEVLVSTNCTNSIKVWTRK